MMQRIKETYILFLVLSIFLSISSLSMAGEIPPFIQTGVAPNVLVIYDTSASMRETTLANKFSGYNKNTDYTSTFQAILDAAGNPDTNTNSLSKHMAQLNGSTGSGSSKRAKPFERWAVYDAYENKMCDDVRNSSCNGLLTWKQKKALKDGLNNMGNQYKYGGWSGPKANGTGSWYVVESKFLGNYLNFLHSNGMRDDITRQALRDLVVSNPDVNFGLMEYGYGSYLWRRGWRNAKNPSTNDVYGALILAEGGDNAGLISALDNYSGDPVNVDNDGNDNTGDYAFVPALLPATDQIKGAVEGSRNQGLIINAFGQTPIARQLAEVYKYFKGQFVDPITGTAYSSCINNYCENSFVIIMTDGYPTNRDLSEAEIRSNPLNYCGTNEFTDTDDNKGLDDLAGCLSDDDLSGLQGDQFMGIYTIGFANTSGNALDLLQDTASNGNGLYYSANNAAQLVEVFNEIMEQIQSTVASGTGAAVLASEETGENKLFRAKLSPAGWKGYLEAFPYPSADYVCDGGAGDTCVWEAGQLLATRSHSSRTIYTALDSDSDGGIDDRLDFTSSNASTLQSFLQVATSSEAERLIDFIRGDNTYEGITYRERAIDANNNTWKLGDIAYSTPVVVGGPPYYYTDSAYQTFLSTYADREKMVYVGANDGMLHAFAIDDDPATSGVDEAGREMWAFIPNNLIGRLSIFADPAYDHEYYVDLTPKIDDVYIDVDGDGSKEWRTVLIGGERGGGKAYFALDITDPNNPDPLWEFPGLGGFTTYPFDNAGLYTLSDATKIEVAGGVARLKSFSVTPSWWDNNYGTRAQVTITNSSACSSTPAGNLVYIDPQHYSLVQGGKSLESGDDLRLLYHSGGTWTELDRVNVGGWNDADRGSDIWFKTQSDISTTDGNYYIYYSNSSAVNPPANGSNIFEFWDDFNDGDYNGWTIGSGTWSVTANNQFKSSIPSGNAIAYRSDVPTRDNLVIESDFTSEANGVIWNGFIMFDYQGPNDFKFAGAREGADRWAIGYYDGSWKNKATFAETIERSHLYRLKVVIRGNRATLYVDGVKKLSYTYASIGTGPVGLVNDRSDATYDNFLTRDYSFYCTDDFNDGDYNGWTTNGGTWTIDGSQLQSNNAANSPATATRSDMPTSSDMLIETDYTSVSGPNWHNGFIVFDYQSATDFKFAGAKEGANYWTIGDYNGNWNNRKTKNETINTNVQYNFKVVIDENTVSLSVDGNKKVEYTFSSIGNGLVGLANNFSIAKFDNFRVSNPDPATAIGSEEGYYPVDNPYVEGEGSGTSFTDISGFVEVLGANNTGSVRYQISHNGGTNWYWFDGNNWTAATDYSTTNVASDINGNISGFMSDLGVSSGTFKFKAYLHSVGGPVELDSVQVRFSGVGNLGESWSIPGIGKMSIDPGTGTEDRWVAFVGSGPENSDTKGYLFAIDIEDGSSLWQQMVNNDDTLNFLTRVRTIDTDSDGYVERVYAGDIAGNFWRGDVSDVNPNSWTTYTTVTGDTPLFDTGDPGTTNHPAPWTAQPITATTNSAFDSYGNLWVYGGTGKFIDSLDSENTDQQSFYGMKDPGTVTVLIDNLEEQTLSGPTVTGNATVMTVDVLSSCSPVNGWYIDLTADGVNPSERVTTTPVIVGGVVFFTTYIPTSDVCSLGGDAWLYALDYETGCATSDAVFDIDGDGDIDADDLVNGDIPVALKIGTGIPSAPLLVGDKVIVQSSDTTIITTNVNVPGAGIQLQYWREEF